MSSAIKCAQFRFRRSCEIAGRAGFQEARVTCDVSLDSRERFFRASAAAASGTEKAAAPAAKSSGDQDRSEFG